MRNRFDQQLAELNKELIKMGSMCEREILRRAVEHWQNGDLLIWTAKMFLWGTRSIRRRRTLKRCI